MSNSNKVGLFHSITLKIFGCVVISIILTAVLAMVTFLPMIQENTSTTAENYMYDMTVAYGEILEREIDIVGKEKALEKSVLSELYADAKVECADSSYVYITDKDGMMLYHPTTDKIGKPVENEVVKGLVANIQQGIIPKPDIITYLFKGENKYAAYYIDDEANYILVLTADESEVFADYHHMMLMTILSVVASLVIFGTLGFIMARLVVKPINRLTKNLLKLSSLDFTPAENQSVLDKRKDETGQMSKALSELREQLIKAFSQIQNQSNILYKASDVLLTSASESSESIAQVENAIGEVATGATSQAEETQKASENVILIGDMIEETGKQVNHLNDNAKTMQEASDRAINTLKQLDDTNSRTRQAIDRIYEQTHTTNVSALKIKDATAMITSIAEETNLLSLNASIEAARAGEQGKGFAVVADQIQKLAEQSNKSAKQIEAIIESLITDSEDAVKIMDSVKMIIEEQSNNVENTGAGFVAVKDGIDVSINRVNEISRNIDKIDTARINVVEVVQNLTAIAEENAATTQETSASTVEVSATMQNMTEQTEKLKEIADQLEQSMVSFKL